ncbi:hypothetical protein K6H10_005013 [Candida tropicalis]
MAQAQKKYVCAFCARAFTRSEHKQRHERSHTNEKPFHCLHCTSSFVRRDLLQRHCRTVHNTNLNPSLLPTNKSLNNPTTNAIELTDNNNNNNNNNGDEFQAIPMRGSFSFDTQDQQHNNHSQQQQQQYSSASFDSFNMTPSNSTASEIIQMIPTTTGSSPTSTIGSNTTSTSNNNNSVKRRKKSSDDGSNRSALKEHHDLIHLLSIAKKLSNLLYNYDSIALSNCNSPSINEIFLIGYSHLTQQSKLFTNFDKILKDLLYYLSTSYLTTQQLNQLHQQHPQQLGGGGNANDGNSTGSSSSSSPHNYQFNNFKIGISYTIISLGYIIDKKPSKSLKFFKKSWNLLIKKLIPQYNNNNNLFDQIEILHNLFLLSYVYLQFNLEGFNINEFESLEDTDGEQIYINNEVILNYLNDISFIIISNLKDVSNSPVLSGVSNSNDNLIDNNINLFWNIYILLSTYLTNQPPPKVYPLFLERSVKNNESLLNIMQKFCKSFINIDDEQLKMIIVSTLSNELKDHKVNQTLSSSSSNSSSPTTSHHNKMTIYSNKNILHNAIILINKSINNHNNHYHHNNRNQDIIKSDATKLFELFKKNLIVNSPLKFHELFNNYIFIPKNYYNWQLLSLTLQEINASSINSSIMNTIESSNGNFQEFENLIKGNFFDYRSNTININNNLLIVSYPIIFFTNYLSLENMINLTSLNNLQFINLNCLIIEWYLIMNKVLIMLFTDDMTNFEDNYILQTLIYLLLDNKSCLLKKLNIQDKNNNSNTSQHEQYQQQQQQEEVGELSFSQKWFWILKVKLDSIFENWLNFIKDSKNNTNVQFNNNLIGFKINLNKMLNEYIITEGLSFKDEDQANPNHQQQQPIHQPPIQQPPIVSHHQSQEYVQTSSYLPLQTSISNNSTNSFMNFDNQHPFKRSNSITIGILAQTMVADESSHNSTNQNSPNQKHQPPRVYNSQQQQQQQQQQVVQPIQQYTSYSAYPPPPPILSNSSNNSLANTTTTTNSKADVLLPPIRREERMTNK